MKRTPSLQEALIPLIAMILLLGIGVGKFRLPSQILLITAAGAAAIIAYRVGLQWKDMMEGIIEMVSTTLPALMIVVFVGGMIASWMVSGTIPLMIYYGVKLIHPQYLFLTGFIVCAVISLFTGTSFGSAGTAGIAVMGTGLALGLPPEVTAGAVISGAIFGDKLSPFSDTTLLAHLSAGSDLYDHIRHMLYTTGAATVLCIIVYTAVGLRYEVYTGADAGGAGAVLASLEQLYFLHPLLLLPPCLIFWGAWTKKAAIPVMLLSTAVALALGIVFQDISLKAALQACVSGFRLNMLPAGETVQVSKTVSVLINRGGMNEMMSTVLLVLCAFMFAGIYNKSGCIRVILTKIVESVSLTGNLIAATIGTVLFMSLVTGSSSLAILIPGEMFKDVYKKFNLAPCNLSRCLEDAGTCIVPIVPWAITGTYLSATLGVATVDYLPWAVLCYSGIIFALIFGYTGFGIKKIG